MLKIFTNYKKALYVCKKQYRVKFLNCKINKKGVAFAIIQIALKRSKIKLSFNDFYSNKNLLSELHPVDAGKVSFLANLDNYGHITKAPGFIYSLNTGSNLIENPYIAIKNQNFDRDKQQTFFLSNY